MLGWEQVYPAHSLLYTINAHTEQGCAAVPYCRASLLGFVIIHFRRACEWHLAYFWKQFWLCRKDLGDALGAPQRILGISLMSAMVNLCDSEWGPVHTAHRPGESRSRFCKEDHHLVAITYWICNMKAYCISPCARCVYGIAYRLLNQH